MKQFEMSNLERVILKRKIKRKKRIKMTIIVLIGLVMILIGIFFIGTQDSTGDIRSIFNKKELNVKTIETPEYIDKQLIDIGIARTGIKISQINSIVIHYVGNPGTTAQNNRDYFNKISTTVCSHFVIGLDGEIIQCVPLDEKSNASNNRNIDTISIEVCHPDSTGKFNSATYDSLVKLTAWLCDNSGLKSSDVIRHYDITGKECPKYFVTNESEWEAFLQDVKKELKKY